MACQEIGVFLRSPADTRIQVRHIIGKGNVCPTPLLRVENISPDALRRGQHQLVLICVIVVQRSQGNMALVGYQPHIQRRQALLRHDAPAHLHNGFLRCDDGVHAAHLPN